MQAVIPGIESLEVPSLDRPLLSHISEEEIDEALSEAALYLRSHRVATREGIYHTLTSSRQYRTLLAGTLGEFLAFLASFQNKKPCGFLHEFTVEMSQKVFDIVVSVTPETCKISEWYSGCGHPERNGLILSLVIGRAILRKKIPDRAPLDEKQKEETYLELIRLDGSSFASYRDPKLQPTIRATLDEAKMIQSWLWDDLERECSWLAQTLKTIFERS